MSFFHAKPLLGNSASPTTWMMKDLCQKMEGMTNFSRHLKVWWLGPTEHDPLILRQTYAVACNTTIGNVITALVRLCIYAFSRRKMHKWRVDSFSLLVLLMYRCPQDSRRWLFSRSSSNLNFLAPTHPPTKNVRLLWISIAPCGRDFRGYFRWPMFCSVYKYKYKYDKGLRSETGQPLDKNDEKK